MKKILIVSYFYKPSNFVAVERIESWVKYLPDNGFFPIVVTRNWNENQKTIVERVHKNELHVFKTSLSEIHSLPVYRSIRDRCSDFRILKPLQKFFTLFELLFSNFFNSFLPFSNFLPYCEKLIKENPLIDTVIVSGTPFKAYSIGYRLKKKFPHLVWIPDYRDEWTTHQNTDNVYPILNKLLFKLDRKSEIKWTSNSNFFITVSTPWRDSIKKLIKKDGVVVKNGFKELIPRTNKSESDPSKLKIVYAGTMYDSQPIELFISSIISYCKKICSGIKLEVHFIGTEIMKTVDLKLRHLTKEYPEVFHFSKRLNKIELLKNTIDTDIFLLTSFKNVIGWYPVKLFDYYSKGKPILLIPSDGSVIEEFLHKTNSGYVVNSEIELHQLLDKLFQKKKNKLPIPYYPNHKEAAIFLRENQTKILADKLKEYSNN